MRTSEQLVYTPSEIQIMITLLPIQERRHVRDGRACIGCGGWAGDMVPVGYWRRVQVFMHPACHALHEEMVARLGGGQEDDS